jgi:hypothetical protein
MRSPRLAGMQTGADLNVISMAFKELYDFNEKMKEKER